MGMNWGDGSCVDCGAAVAGRAMRCERCKRSHNAETQQQYTREHYDSQNRHDQYTRVKRAHQQDPWLGSTVVVLVDPRPVDDGGFRAGALITNKELKYMLAAGDSLLDGTRLWDGKAKKEYIVERGALCPAGK